jgi:hypothetical protein
MTTFSIPVKWYPLWAVIVLVLVVLGFFLVDRFPKYRSSFTRKAPKPEETPLRQSKKGKERVVDPISVIEEGANSVPQRAPLPRFIRRGLGGRFRGFGRSDQFNPTSRREPVQYTPVEEPLKVPLPVDPLTLTGAGIDVTRSVHVSSTTASDHQSGLDIEEEGVHEDEAGPSTLSPLRIAAGRYRSHERRSNSPLVTPTSQGSSEQGGLDSGVANVASSSSRGPASS